MPQGHTIEDMAADYADLIAAEFDGKVDLVVGLSTGGLIGQYLAANHPDRFDHIALVGAAHTVSEQGRRLDYDWAAARSLGDWTGAGRVMAGAMLSDSWLRFLDADEVWRLADTIDPRYRAFVVTGAFTGMRPGELRALRLDHVNMLGRTIQVEETLADVRGHVQVGPVKTAASRRQIKMPKLLVDALARHLHTYPATGDGFVFTAPNGGPIRKDNFRRRTWLPAVAAAGLEGVRVHDLRHTHAALLIAQGEHPKVIQSRLGHASITTTLDRYGHLFEGLDEAAADGLDDAYGQSGVGLPWG
jgi:integrase